MSGLPMAALDRHVDLVRFYRSRWGCAYADAELRQSLLMPDVPPGDEPLQFLAASLDVAETFALTDDIHDVIDEAKATLPEFVLHHDDVPSPHGYVHFETTRYLLDRHRKTLAVTGIGWSGVRVIGRNPADRSVVVGLVDPESEARPDLLAVWLFTDPSDPGDHMHEHWRDDLHQHPGAQLPDAAQILNCHGLSLYSGQIAFDTPLTFSTPEVEQLSIVPFLVTMFRFVGEPWVGWSKHPVGNRAAEKRARRAGRDPEVRVVALRRRSGEAVRTVGESIEYSHRFFVRGHWRNQWYPSRGEHAPRYIPTYVKGPDGAPLVIKDRVFHVAR